MVVAAVTANRAAVSLLARALAPRSRATATKTSYWLSSSAICTAGDARWVIFLGCASFVSSVSQIFTTSLLSLFAVAREKSFEIKFPAQNA